MQVDFYQLGGGAADRVLARIAERLIAAGERLLVVADDRDLLGRIDQALWCADPESFLPHAIDGGERDGEQPVLLSTEAEAGNGARNLAIADGRWRGEALGFDRAFHLFDEEALADARQAWRDLGGRAEVTRNFWRQEGGRWTKAA